MSPSALKPNVLIFRVTGGIGSALARQLHTLGYGLILAARRNDRLNALDTELRADACPVEATDSGSVEACVTQAFEQHERLDGVGNCVGSILLKPAHCTSDEEWAAVLAANLNSSFDILRSATSRMMRSGGGSIVMLASAVAQRDGSLASCLQWMAVLIPSKPGRTLLHEYILPNYSNRRDPCPSTTTKLS